MEKLICENCGAAINPQNMRCEYCGTYYKRDADNHIIRVETFQNPVKVYKSQILLDSYITNSIGREETAKMTINQLSRNLAEAIAPNMEIETEYDPVNMRQRISARVRIIEPKHMF